MRITKKVSLSNQQLYQEFGCYSSMAQRDICAQPATGEVVLIRNYSSLAESKAVGGISEQRQNPWYVSNPPLSEDKIWIMWVTNWYSGPHKNTSESRGVSLQDMLQISIPTRHCCASCLDIKEIRICYLCSSASRSCSLVGPQNAGGSPKCTIQLARLTGSWAYHSPRQEWSSHYHHLQSTTLPLQHTTTGKL